MITDSMMNAALECAKARGRVADLRSLVASLDMTRPLQMQFTVRGPYKVIDLEIAPEMIRAKVEADIAVAEARMVALGASPP